MKNSIPSISVIIPTYNNEMQISECLKSLITQSENILEIIVVNDGSTDTTEKVVNATKKNSEKISLINISNHGVSYARNLGVKKAKGDYITFVDADDYLNKDTISVVLKLIKENNYPDFLRYNFNEFGGKRFSNHLYGLDRGLLNVPKNRKEINKHLLSNEQSIPNLCQLLVIKSRIAKSSFFNENIVYLEDQLYYQQLLSRSKNALFTGYVGYNLRTTNNSSSTSPMRVEKNIESLLIVNKILHKANIPGIEFLDDAHFRLMLGKVFQLSACSKKMAIALIDKEEIKSFALRLLSASDCRGVIKYIAKCISSQKAYKAIFLIRVRGYASILKRKVMHR